MDGFLLDGKFSGMNTAYCRRHNTVEKMTSIENRHYLNSLKEADCFSHYATLIVKSNPDLSLYTVEQTI